jgi:hypothetical protein
MRRAVHGGNRVKLWGCGLAVGGFGLFIDGNVDDPKAVLRTVAKRWRWRRRRRTSKMLKFSKDWWGIWILFDDDDLILMQRCVDAGPDRRWTHAFVVDTNLGRTVHAGVTAGIERSTALRRCLIFLWRC